MTPRYTNLFLFLPLLACGMAASCVTETEGGPRRARGMATSGIIVNDGVEETWRKVQSVMGDMTSEPLQTLGVQRTLKTNVNGADVTVIVEDTGNGTTAVHVKSSNQAVADQIRFRIQN